MEILTINQIKAQYPNQWVLVGNPELENPEVNGTIVSKLLKGIVLLASTNKREIGFKAKEVQYKVNKTACIYTGEIPKNRLFLL
ncbi:MAG: hypothetical protein EAZ53_13275 [Bacteroidetes bacterium]|nr:MAG: hypothetical protein EAZ53_13275 [Bacteroidota bacterium]